MMLSRVAVAQIVWGSKEVWWASRTASTASKAASKEGSKSASATATPAAPAPTPTPATKTRTRTAKQTVKSEPKPVPVSPTLRHFLGGVVESTRPKAVKHVWDYIREHHLQDPTHKTIIICDDELKAVLGKDRVGFTEIVGLLNSHFPEKEVKKKVKKS